MSSSPLASLKNVDILVIVIDLMTPVGTAFVNEAAKMEIEVKGALCLARMLRNSYLIIVKNVSTSECVCIPCHDKEALQDGVNHAYRLAIARVKKVVILTMPDALASHVYTQVLLTKASLR